MRHEWNGVERRRFLSGLVGLVTAPAVVHAASLMPISPLDPAWIANHQDNALFGTLEVRLRHARNLDSFHGLIEPGQFFWRRGNRIVDICMFPKTRLDVTSGMISIRNEERPVPASLLPLVNGRGRRLA